jgi:hypothetical protein
MRDRPLSPSVLPRSPSGRQSPALPLYGLQKAGAEGRKVLLYGIREQCELCPSRRTIPGEPQGEIRRGEGQEVTTKQRKDEKPVAIIAAATPPFGLRLKPADIGPASRLYVTALRRRVSVGRAARLRLYRRQCADREEMTAKQRRGFAAGWLTRLRPLPPQPPTRRLVRAFFGDHGPSDSALAASSGWPPAPRTARESAFCPHF